MTDWRDHLTPDEKRRLEQIRAAMLELRRERDAIQTRARVRKHRA